MAIKPEDQDFAMGGLRAESFARPEKLVTADANLVLSIEGKLTATAFQHVLRTVVNLMRVGHA